MPFVLAATETIRGVGGSATSITYTLTGDEVSAAGADVFKTLAQGQLPSPVGTLYTVPASTSTIIKQIILTNSTGAAVTARLFINGTAATNEIMPTISIPAGGFAVYTGESFEVFDSTGSRLVSVPSHGASLHSGNVLPGANQNLGAFYLDVGEIAAPATPGANVRRIFADAADNGLKTMGDDGIKRGLEGWEFLGSTVLSGAATTTATVTIPARDCLLISVRVTGYGGADIASFRFNGDTGANYWSRYVSVATAGTVLANAQNVSQTLARLFATAVAIQRSATVHVTNRSANTKVGAVRGQTNSGAAGTAPVIEFGGFEWVNTAAQITSVVMVSAAGATLSAGTGFAVFGINL